MRWQFFLSYEQEVQMSICPSSLFEYLFFSFNPLKNDSIGWMIFETAVDDKSLPAFFLLVISGDSPLIALQEWAMIAFCFLLSLYKRVYPNIFYRYTSLLFRLSTHSLLNTVESFSFAAESISISEKDIVPFLRKATAWNLIPSNTCSLSNNIFWK